MKSNLPAILVLLACAGLGIVLWTQNQTHPDQSRDLDQTINIYSNLVATLQVELAREAADNAALSNKLAAIQLTASNHLRVVETIPLTTSADLDKAQAEAINLSNIATTLQAKLTEQLVARAKLETSLSTTAASLQKAQAEAKAAADAIAAAAAAIAAKDKKILELQGQNTDLEKEFSDLRGSITNLEAQIQATQKKLDASNGDKQLLMAELKRLQAQKEDLQSR